MMYVSGAYDLDRSKTAEMTLKINQETALFDCSHIVYSISY